MTDTIADFAASYFDYHSISKSRRKDSMRVLRALERQVAPRTITDATARDVQRFLEAALRIHAPSTVRKYLNLIRPFFTWMWHEKLVDAERLLEVRELRPPRGSANHLPKPYKRTEIQQMWTDLEAQYPVAWHGGRGTDEQRAELFLQRWRRGHSRWSRVQPHFKRAQLEAIIWLALGAGLRKDEIFRLGVEDMHPDNAYIAVGGAAKNPDGESRQRPVPWCAPEVRTAVAHWIELRDLLDPPHDSAWLSLHQDHYLKPLRFRQFSVLLAGLGSGWRYHRLRHTFATEQLRSGQKIEKLQKILGHTRIEQTLKYTQILEGDVVKAAERVEAKFSTALRRAA